MVDPLPPRALSSLIGSIYDCALEPSRWEATLGEIRDALDSRSAVLHLNDLRENRVLIRKVVGLDPYWVDRADEYVPEMHKLLPAQPEGDAPFVLSRHVEPSLAAGSPFVREYLAPQGLVDVMQLFLVHTPARFSGLGVAWDEGHGVMTDDEFQLAGLLLPHIRRAVTISDVLDVRAIESARMAEGLDALRCAVLFTDERGAILHTNRAADELLQNGDMLQVVGGALQAKSPPAAVELRAAIALAAKDEAQIGKSGLAVLLTNVHTPPRFAHVLPLTGGDLRTRLQPAAAAAVFIGAPPDDQDGVETVAASFGLTPAETRVLASLLGGRTLAETAVALGVALTTVKTHLDRIFSKTGVSRQADLMRLATRVLPPTASRR